MSPLSLITSAVVFVAAATSAIAQPTCRGVDGYAISLRMPAYGTQ